MLENISISLVSKVGIFVAILLATILFAYFFNRIFSRFIRRSSIIIRNDPTNYQFLKHAISGLIYLLGLSLAIYSVPELKRIASTFLAGAGIFAIAVGFASQHALSNIISGIFIIIFKPFRVNDRLRLPSDLSGIVEDITLRHTIIRDFENRRIIIPNSVISEEVIINSDFGDDRICLWFEVKVSFEADITLAQQILKEEACKHPLHIDNRTLKEIEDGVDIIKTKVLEIEQYALKLRAWIWTKNAGSAFDLRCDLLEQVIMRFREEGIEMPYPHVTYVNKVE